MHGTTLSDCLCRCAHSLSQERLSEGLPNRVSSTLGEIGGGCSGGTLFGRGVVPAGLADRSDWPIAVRGSSGRAVSIKVLDLGGPGWPRAR